ncbi:MAG: 2-oxo acid dehydrogenase subunit E2, partial [Alphaproteobacteria bacterium]|nr:2-oxo acid dehydrogenase subunit E2 [Alphaproteobacteria bacterium]
MTIEITVPTLGESVTEATVAKWLKQPGEPIERDEPVVELETDKVTLEVPAPAGGTLGEIRAAEGANVPVGAVLGIIADGAAGSPHPPAAAAAGRPSPAVREGEKAPSEALERAGPAVRKLLAESGLDLARVTPTGRGGRITKADVIAARDQSAPAPIKEPPAEPAPPPPRERREPPQPVKEPPTQRPPAERETRVRMTRLRRRIAERLKEAQQTAAMLTTFNEIDMSGAIGLRERWREAFEKKHGVRLGFMSIFVKAAIVALKELPAVNAEIDGDDLVYKNHYDIGVAVGTEQGLVVPVVRDADKKSFA